MKPVDQIVFAKNTGDCVRACIASILEFPIDEMPNFWEHTQDTDTFWRLGNDWLSSNKGFRLVPISVNPGHEYLLKGMLCVAVGNTNRSTEEHAVVWMDGIAHDPNPITKRFKRKSKYICAFCTLKPL